MRLKRKYTGQGVKSQRRVKLLTPNDILAKITVVAEPVVAPAPPAVVDMVQAENVAAPLRTKNDISKEIDGGDILFPIELFEDALRSALFVVKPQRVEGTRTQTNGT